MKPCFILFAILAAFPYMVSASLKENCYIYGGTYKSKVYLAGYNIATIADGSLQLGIEIKVGNNWYLSLLSEKSKDNNREEMASLARVARVLNLPVNVCINKKYLLGIEL